MDRYFITLAALKALADDGVIPRTRVADTIERYGIDINKPDPAKI